MNGLASEMGIANPSPSTSASSSFPLILATVMPTTWPCSLIKAPPEFPEFKAAEVWIRFMLLPSTSTSTCRAEMMPSVIVP